MSTTDNTGGTPAPPKPPSSSENEYETLPPSAVEKEEKDVEVDVHPPKEEATTTAKETDMILQMEEGQKITLKDVANTAPYESGDESAMIRTLEANERNNNQKAEQSLGSGIMEGVPEEANDVFHQTSLRLEKEKHEKENNNKRKAFADNHEQHDTIEEELYAYVDELGGSDSDETSVSSSVSGGGGKSSRRRRKSSKIGNKLGKVVSDADTIVKKARKMKIKSKIKDGSKETYSDFKSFFFERKTKMWSYTKFALLVAILATGIAAVLFYFVEHQFGVPIEGKNTSFEGASTSWWILFLFVRLVCTWTLAAIVEAIVIDFFCLRHPVCLRLFGSYVTLLLVQSKGWPFHIMTWSGINFAMLYGDREFARHWLFYQDFVKLFSKANPAGTVTTNIYFRNLLIFFLCFGAAVALKRFFVGLWYGRSVYQRYGKDLTAVMQQAVLIKKVAKHAKNLIKTGDTPRGAAGSSRSMHDKEVRFSQLIASETIDEDGKNNEEEEEEVKEDDPDLLTSNAYNSDLGASQRMKIKRLLGEWEEPMTDDRSTENADISSIVQFKTAVNCIDKQYPFSTAFGLADTRENCKLPPVRRNHS